MGAVRSESLDGVPPSTETIRKLFLFNDIRATKYLSVLNDIREIEFK